MGTGPAVLHGVISVIFFDCSRIFVRGGIGELLQHFHLSPAPFRLYTFSLKTFLPPCQAFVAHGIEFFRRYPETYYRPCQRENSQHESQAPAYVPGKYFIEPVSPRSRIFRRQVSCRDRQPQGPQQHFRTKHGNTGKRLVENHNGRYGKSYGEQEKRRYAHTVHHGVTYHITCTAQKIAVTFSRLHVLVVSPREHVRNAGKGKHDHQQRQHHARYHAQSAVVLFRCGA